MIDLIRDVEEMTPAWLTAVLAAAGHDVRVVGLEATPIGTGQMSQSIRVVPHVEGDAPGVPASLVVKIPGLSETARAGGAAGAYPSEVRFYSAVAATVAIEVPRCHLALLSPDGADFLLVLDDLAPARQGDQLSGCDPDQAAAAVTALAGLAGPRWCDPTLADIDGLDRPRPDTVAFWSAVFAEGVETFLARYGDRVAAVDADTLRGAAAVMERWMLARADRFSLIHGDFRLDNLLFDPDDPTRVVTVDWQTLNLGLPARDLAYFCGNSLTEETRRACERDLVATYHDALVAHGVTDHAAETCWDDYRFGHLQGPLITVLGAVYADPTERGDEMFLAMTRRCCAAIRDLDTLGLVDRDG